MRLSSATQRPLLTAFFWTTAITASAAVHAQGTPPEGSFAAILRREAIAYEHGEGVSRDPTLAAALYCKSARLGDPQAQYNLGWMYTNGRGVERDDVTAAYFFQAAADQGLEEALRMVKVVGTPHRGAVPACLREPAPAAPAPRPAAAPVKVAVAPSAVDYRAIAPRNILDLVMKMAPLYQVEPQLALAIIAAESNFNSRAISPKNAQGLMQLMPETSERFDVKNAFDPVQNLRGGLRYLRWLLAYFEGDVALVAAAYNAGEGKVERYQGIPPYFETRAYVLRIVKSVGTTHHPFDATVTPASSVLAGVRMPWRVQ